MNKKSKEDLVKRILIINILIKSLIESDDIKFLRLNLEDLVMQEIITELESKKIRETFRDLLADLNEIAPVIIEEDSFKTDILLTKLTAENSKFLFELCNNINSHNKNFAIITGIRDFFLSSKGEKLTLVDCKNIFNYFKKK